LLFLVILGYHFLTRVMMKGERREESHKQGTVKLILFFCILPYLFLFGLNSGLYAHLKLASLPQAPFKFIHDLLLAFSLSSTGDPWTENYAFLFLSYGGPVIFLALIGMVSSWKENRQTALFYSLWFGIFFLTQTYVIGHKEARYLFPLFIPLYAFSLSGITQVWRLIQTNSPSKQRLLGIFGTLLLFAVPFKNTWAEIHKFQDPFYQNDFEKKVSLYADKLAGRGQIFWIGYHYPLRPKEFYFHAGDEVAYVYHFFNHVVRFYTRRQVFAIEEAQIFMPEDIRQGVLIPHVAELVRDGDALIINTNPSRYNTDSMPKTLNPIIVQRARIWTFISEDEEITGFQKFTHPAMPEAEIALIRNDDGYEIRGSGLPDRSFEVYLAENTRTIPLTQGAVKIEKGKFSLKPPADNPPPLVRVALLVTYDQMKPFFHPGMEPDRQGYLKEY